MAARSSHSETTTGPGIASDGHRSVRPRHARCPREQDHQRRPVGAVSMSPPRRRALRSGRSRPASVRTAPARSPRTPRQHGLVGGPGRVAKDPPQGDGHLDRHRDESPTAPRELQTSRSRAFIARPAARIRVPGGTVSTRGPSRNATHSRDTIRRRRPRQCRHRRSATFLASEHPSDEHEPRSNVPQALRVDESHVAAREADRPNTARKRHLATHERVVTITGPFPCGGHQGCPHVSPRVDGRCASPRRPASSRLQVSDARCTRAPIWPSAWLPAPALPPMTTHGVSGRC